MKILVTPAHYVLDKNSASEFYYAATLLYGLAIKNPTDQYHVLCGYCADKAQLPTNLKVFELFKSQKLTLTLWTRIRFYIWIFLKSLQLFYSTKFDVVWHLLPNGIYSFNPFIFFGFPRLFGVKKLIIGRLAHSYGELESNLLIYDKGKIDVQQRNGDWLYSLIYKMLSPFSRYYFSLFNTLIFYNEFSKRDFERILKTDLSSRSKIIPVGFDSTQFPFKAKSIMGKLNFLYSGNLIPRKNVNIAIRICKLLKDAGINFEFDIVGDGYERGKLIALTKELNLEQDVIFHGLKQKTEMHRFYEKAHFLFLLSSMEAFGHVLLEAWSSGALFIGSQIPVFEDVIDHLQTGYLLDIKDPACLTELIKWLKTLKQEQYDSIIEVSCASSQQYEWGAIIEKYNFELSK